MSFGYDVAGRDGKKYTVLDNGPRFTPLFSCPDRFMSDKTLDWLIIKSIDHDGP